MQFKCKNLKFRPKYFSDCIATPEICLTTNHIFFETFVFRLKCVQINVLLTKLCKPSKVVVKYQLKTKMRNFVDVKFLQYSRKPHYLSRSVAQT